MAVSAINVADSAVVDKRLHTNQRTISGTAREDQFVLLGESPYPTYDVTLTGLTVASANDHIAQIMADGTNYSRLKRIQIFPTYATSAGLVTLALVRVTTAGTGGSASSANAYDAADTYAGGVRYSLSSLKGTEGATLWQCQLHLPASTIGFASPMVEWTAHPGAKPIIFGTEATKGVVLKVINNVTGGLVTVNLELITTSYL